MATAKSVDEYISKLNKKYLGVLSGICIGIFLLALFVSYFSVTSGSAPPWAYATILLSILVFIWGITEQKRYVGSGVWNILCPKCNEYIPLHQFVCEPPCEHEYTDRSIIEGCPVCHTRYKKKGHDALRWAVCDNCSYELEFDEPYDFKPWSVLSKGQTWETETILVINKTFYYVTSVPLLILGGGMLLLSIIALPGSEQYFLLSGGIYFGFMGFFFMVIHVSIYGNTKRIPNPTFKRKVEPEELYAPKNNLVSLLLFEFITPVLFLGGVAVIFDMLIKMFILPYNPYMEELTRYTYSPFDIAWRFIPIVAATILIIYHNTAYEAYKKVPNPRYKEESS